MPHTKKQERGEEVVPCYSCICGCLQIISTSVIIFMTQPLWLVLSGGGDMYSRQMMAFALTTNNRNRQYRNRPSLICILRLLHNIRAH